MKTIVVNIVPEETRAAVLEDGELERLEVERASQCHLVGNIYKGRVQNVLPGMQAAFVDIGTGKNAFLYIGDGMPQDLKHAPVTDVHIHTGQYLPVQILKDPIGSKGPRATTHISLPGRNVVLMPTAAYIAMSRQIEDENERNRLHAIAERICPEDMGLIIRTAAVGQSEEDLREDVESLLRLWQIVQSRFKLRSKGPALLYRDADLIIRTVRDLFTEDIEKLIVDDREGFQRVKELVEYLSPTLAGRVELYEGRKPIFSQYRIDEEIEKIGSRRVDLKSGGFLVIDKTEALTVIDVNTGRYVGKSHLGDTVYQTNLEAASEIMRQIRLRDIGGIIVIDFIDMEKDEQKEHLLTILREAAKRDRTKTKVVDITPLGLVEITRRKTRQNLESIVYSECPVCHGRGRIESPETVSIRISRAIRRMEKSSHASEGYEIEVHESVAEELQQSQLMMNLAAEFGTDIKVTVKPGMHPEQYSILQQS